MAIQHIEAQIARNTSGRTYILVCLLISCFLIINSCKISNPAKYNSRAKEKAPFDAIIVPGVPFENGEWSRVMKLRVYWAHHLYEDSVARNIIFSGGAVYTPYPESDIMKLYAIEMGIPEDSIATDRLAQHSTENIFYSYHVAQENGWDRLALATDPYQAKLLKPFIRKMRRKLDVEISILPAIMEEVVKDSMPDFEIDYESVKAPEIFIDITNTQSKFYRLRGTLGKHIDWESTPKQPE